MWGGSWWGLNCAQIPLIYVFGVYLVAYIRSYKALRVGERDLPTL